jgi:hypothetical protein
MFSDQSYFWQTALSNDSFEANILAAEQEYAQQNPSTSSGEVTSTSGATNSSSSTSSEVPLMGGWQVVENIEHNPYYYEDNEEENGQIDTSASTTAEGQPVVQEQEEPQYKGEASDSDSEKEVDTKEMKSFQNSSFDSNNGTTVNAEEITFVKRKQNSGAQKKSFRRKTE